LVEKNKFILQNRDDVEPDVLKDFVNTKDTYDHIWGDSNFVLSYEEEKDELYQFIVTYVRRISDSYDVLNVLDVGCGTGGLLSILSAEIINANINGCDFSDSSVNLCKERMPQGNFFVADIFNLQLVESRFEVVLCMEVLEHIQFVDDALKSLMQLVSLNGVLIITIPDGYHDGWIGHVNFWTQDEFSSLLQLNNLDIEFSTRIDDGCGGGYLVYICKVYLDPNRLANHL
jgi:2-polyprenyl-3-methyl-5-hydroxy-6-metoxy-1,4-benzoquinol methylase